MMNAQTRLAAVALLALLAALTGCATTGAHGEQSLILIGTDTEVQMGIQSDAGIRQEYPVLQDAAITAYVQEIGQKVAAHSDRTDVEYSFTVLDSDVINAFAAPGGFIYITSGLLALADDEAEVACVLSHEVGHVVGRHSVRSMQQAMGVQMAAALVLGDQSAWNQVAGLGAGLFSMKNSRDHEFAADEFGVKYAVAAGYDPEGMVRFFQKLVDTYGAGAEGVAGWMSTHPNTNERIAEAQQEMTRYDLSGHPRNRFADRYLSRTASLRPAS
ncbi:MAG TPA: M48 family metallopeptidase [Candidatus Krumholzibacteria bacterium]|nr:M48 family metallopeptidase [Candidatus Krumholzibacteria bacterium]HRX51248.1 M48 family metallopeptidase [Candidatus Krumholzibacteria bacterium]